MQLNGTYSKPRKAAPNTPDYSRLCSAARTALKVMEVYRANRREMVREYAGHKWSENASRKAVPLNLLALYVQIVGRSLISQNPQFNLTTFDKSKKPDAAKAKAWVNTRVEEMDLSDSLRRAVVDALFGLGIMKVGLARPDDAMSSGWTIRAGMPFAEPVSIDDFLIDTYATRFTDATWMGHRYRMPMSAAVARFGKKKAESLPDEPPNPYNATGDERIQMLGRMLYGESQEFEPQVSVWEFYLPAYRKVVTFADDLIGTPWTGNGYDVKCLEEVEWVGPDCGPYHFLGFDVVPGNLLPKGPIMDLMELHEKTNVLLRKLIRQGERQKENLAVGNQAADAGQRLIQSADGESINCNSPDQLKPIVSGGPHQGNFVLMQQLKELFNWAAGNVDLQGGLGQQSRTATQDKMLNENASKLTANLQEQTVKFTASVGKSLIWYWWNHPELRMETEYSVPGVGDVSIVRSLPPEVRKRTPYSALNVKVEPYSLIYQSPQQKAAMLTQIVTQVLTPMMPILQPQGVGFDAHAFVDTQARYLDLPELADVVVFQEPLEPQGTGGAHGKTLPSQTERTYTRNNVSGMTGKGQDLAMANAMGGTESGGDPSGGGGW